MKGDKKITQAGKWKEVRKREKKLDLKTGSIQKFLIFKVEIQRQKSECQNGH